MSRRIKSEMCAWSYLNCKIFDGVNISGSRSSCKKLQANLDSFFASTQESTFGRLILETVPVTKQQIRNVASPDSKFKSYQMLVFQKADESRVVISEEQIEIALTKEDLEVFKKALIAIQEGIGDFVILDEIRFWNCLS